MDHVPPGGGKKWYWTVYDIPANVRHLPKDSQTIGKLGTGFKGAIGYEPPNSKGAGAKTYVLTMYALSAPLELDATPGSITPSNDPGIGFTPDPASFAPYVVREAAISQRIWQRR